MSTQKLEIKNVSTNIILFSYQNASDSVWYYQSQILPGQEKHIWCVKNTFSYSRPINGLTVFDKTTTLCGVAIPVTIGLKGFYFSGSVGAGYQAIANQILNDDVTINFTNVLGTFTGPPLLISSSVKILSGQISGYTQTFTDYDYDDLTQVSSFTGITFNVTGSTRYNFTGQTTGSTFNVTPTPTPTPTVTPTNTQTPTVTPTNTPTPTNTVTPTPSITPTITPTPTNTVTPTPSITPTLTSTPTPTPTITETPTNTPTPTITETPTNTPTPTITETPTNTPTPTITETPTNTPTPTITETPTPTPTQTPTQTPTGTPAETPTPTPTETPVPTPA
jgi:hypothetical protein